MPEGPVIHFIADGFVAQLGGPRFRRRPLAALLLDQSFAAGMGNYLRSELLYAAGWLHRASHPTWTTTKSSSSPMR